ncbi:MAG: peroxiredoxin family protein [Gemmatimonadaceae bacterium]
MLRPMNSARISMGRTLRLALLPASLAFTPVSAAFAQAAMSPMAPQSVMLGPVDGKDLPPTDLERIAIGTSAPDFTLAKYGGGTTTLSSVKGKKNVVLVFYRGYWCPYCIAQLKEMRTLLTDELKKDTEMLVVSIDDDKGTAMALTRITADGMKPDFTFLSDPEHEVIARYGVLNPAGTRRGIPHPATFVIDKKGMVQWKDIQTDYKIRPTNAAVLGAVKALPAK